MVKLKPRNFLSQGRATVLFCSLTLSFSRWVDELWLTLSFTRCPVRWLRTYRHTEKAPGKPALLNKSSLLLWQYVAHARVNHHEVSILRRSGSHKPRAPSQVRSLGNQLNSSVLRVLPEGLGPVEGSLLNG